MRELALARTHTACTNLHGPPQRSPALIPGMRRPPRSRIALIDQPLLPKQLQGVEAHRTKKRCHESSDTISCTRGRPQASKTSARRQAGQRRAHGHAVVLTSAPHRGQPPRQLQVEEELAVLPPVVSATPRPPAAGSRRSRGRATLPTRSVSSSRATPSTPSRRRRFIEIRDVLQVCGRASSRRTTHILGLTLGSVAL